MTTHSRNTQDRTYTPRHQNPSDSGDGRVDPDGNHSRTRIHGNTKPLDLCLPEGDGTLTREEYYRNRDNND